MQSFLSKVADHEKDANELFKLLDRKHLMQTEYETDVSKITKDINDLDRGGMKFLTPKDIDKKYKLQDLLVKRRTLHQKETHFLEVLQKYKQQYLLSKNEFMTFKQPSQSDQFQQREEILKFKLQYEQIQTERAKILKDLQNPNVLTSAGMQVFQDVTQNYNYHAAQAKMNEDQARIQLLRSMQHDTLMQQELDEVMNSGPGDNVYNHVKYLYKGKMGRNQRDQLEHLTKLRQQLEEYNAGNTSLVLPIEEIGKNKPPEYKAIQYQNQIDQLRSDYVKAGGTDPNFILNLSSLEKQLNKQTVLSAQNSHRENNNFHGQNYPTGQRYLSTAQSVPQLVQIPQYQAHNFQLQGNQPIYAQGLQSSQPPLNHQQLSSHPIYKYLPNSFKDELLQLSGPQLPEKKSDGNTRDEQQTADEITLHYLRNQEAELLLQMSRLDSRHPEHTRLMGQYQELLKLRSAIEKQIFDKRVAEAIKKDEKMKKNLLKGVNLTFDRHSRAANYAASEGFALFFDYVSNLEIQYHTCRINYGIFRRGSDMYPYKQTRDQQTAFESYRSNKAVFFEREGTRDLESFPDTHVFIELWGFQTDTPEVIGWSMLRLFDDDQKLLVGRFRVPIYSKKLNPNYLFKQPLPYANNTLIYLRVSLPGDPILDSSDIILVESEYHMPEMHIHTTAHMASLAEIQDVYLKDINKAPPRKSLPSVDLGKQSDTAGKVGGEATHRNSTGRNTHKNRFSKVTSNNSKLATPVSSKTPNTNNNRSYNSDSPNLQLQLVRLANLVSKEFNQLQLKLGIFFGAKMLEDIQQNPQMALLDLNPTTIEENEIKFKVKHEFTVTYDWLQNFKGEECMIFMGFFRNKRELFGWLAIPLFFLDQGEYALKLGSYSTNLLAPPGQSPPFNPVTMKKQEIEINFIIMTTDQKASSLPLYDDYQGATKAKGSHSQSKQMDKSNLSLPTAFKRRNEQSNDNSQINSQTVRLILETMTTLPIEAEYLLKIVLVCGEKVVYDVNKNKCAITSRQFQSKGGNIDFEDEAIEFEVDFSSELNKQIKKENCQLVLYVINITKTVTWFAHDLVKFGRFNLPTFELPWQKPPINKQTIKNSPTITISFDMKRVR